MKQADEFEVRRHLRVLGLGSDADDHQIRTAYRREIKRWHPDMPGGDASRARSINEAKDWLLNHRDCLQVHSNEAADAIRHRRPHREVAQQPVIDPRPTNSGRGPSFVASCLLAVVVGYMGLLLLSVIGWMACLFLGP